MEKSTKIFCSFFLLTFNITVEIETPEHNVLKSEGRFELREYEYFLIAKTTVKNNYKEATVAGFRRIANYIFGGNQKKMAIEMTAPVILDVPNMNDIYEILFVMPSQHSLEELPAPDQSNIEIKIKELGKTAVIKFGGWATESRTTHYKERLQGFVENSGYSINSDYMVAQYNSPWALPPFRKNEIIVMIE